VLTLEPKTHADVQRVLLQLGTLVQVAEPGRVWVEIDQGLAATARSLIQQARATQVYFEVDRAPYAAGQASFIGETLSRLGLGNIVPRELGVFPKLNPEFVVRANPGVIMVGQVGAAELGKRPGWGSMLAVREGRVCAFAQTDFEMLGRPGPRMVEAAQLMAKCVNEKTRNQPKGGNP
jgi:iron complex transport system substrate-binding protein